VRMWSGRAFQAAGPACENARSPNFVRMYDWTLYNLLCCSEVSAVSYVGNEAGWRENEDGVKRAIFLVDPTQRVVQDGQLVAWDVYTTRGRRSQTVHLQVKCSVGLHFVMP